MGSETRTSSKAFVSFVDTKLGVYSPVNSSQETNLVEGKYGSLKKNMKKQVEVRMDQLQLSSG